MRWQLIDRLADLAPWQRVVARKAVSLEEYDLLAPLGRAGVLPESLLLETAVAALRALVEVSSQATRTAVLAAVDDFRYAGRAGCGDVVTVAAAVTARDDATLTARCDLRAGGRPLAAGTLTVALLALAEVADPRDAATLARELATPTGDVAR